MTDNERPIATWIFVDPDGFECVHKYLYEHYANAFRGQQVVPGQVKAQISEAMWTDLLRFPYYVKVITQFVGYIVYVPPQWMHAVFTVQKCLKLSWEVVEPLHFFNYAKVWSQQQTAMPDPAKDYTAFMHIATNYLTSGRWTLC